MADLQIEQQQGPDSQVKTKKGGKMQSGNAYEFPEHEEHLVHVELETPEFDRVSGRKTSIPRVQTFYADEFDRMERQGAFGGMNVEILHAPSGKISSARKKEISEKNAAVDDLTVPTPVTPEPPKIVSDPGAGTLLVDVLEAKTEAQLREVHTALYPEVDNSSLSKEDLKADITDRVGEYGKESNVTLKAQYDNQLKGLGLL
jgi:hypothetical protein